MARDTSKQEARMVIPVALSPRSHELMQRWLEQHGTAKVRFIEQLLEFFAIAPPSLQHLMTGTVATDLRPEFARKAAEFFLAMADRPPEVDVLVQLAQTATLTSEQREQIADALKKSRPVRPLQKKKIA